ncbi:MAG: LamG domain-containing protein [Planctomycetes bacterium]|nr:LamG domain-containing protein [Planctomycetota bacterium]
MCKRFVRLISLIVVLTVVYASRAELIGHWTLDETSGTTATDTSGREHHGTYVDSPGLDIPGVHGTGMDAATGYMEVDLGTDLPIQAEERTIALWINTPEVRGDRKFCGYGTDTAGQALTFCIENVNGEDGVRLRHWGGNMFYPGFTTGEWNHIAIRVSDGATITNDTEVFINGENIPTFRSGGSDQTLNTAATLFYVGTSIEGQTGQVFEGLLDDVYFYDHALSEAEILGTMSGQPWPYALGPEPADGTLIEDTWVNLSWKPGDFAVSHDVYIGDNFNAVDSGAEDTFQGNQEGTFIVAGFPGFAFPDGLVPGTTYYWRIDEVNNSEPNSPWKGDIWRFSVPPKTAYFPDPVDGAESVAVDVELGWTLGFGAKLHTVYFGDIFEEVDNATDGQTQGTATYTPGTLKMAKTYYWRVDEFDIVETHKGDVWSFTTEGAVEALDPTNGAVDVTQTPVLTWAPGLGASHEIYFGADAASLELRGSGNLGSESYEPSQLEWNTTYYWRVDEANNANADSPWTGPLWNFTTANFLTIDDMESYNDIDESEPGSNRIYLAWIDGFDNPAVNGSIVGYANAPFAEQTIVHSGLQSMPMAYDNAVGKSEATLNLTSNRDWTVKGVNRLTIWFRGNSANAAETLYVMLNESAVVDNDNPNAAQAAVWTEWTIDLQAFDDQGVNLSNVASITLGLRSVTGGTGMMYFDDIQLHPPAQ